MSEVEPPTAPPAGDPAVALAADASSGPSSELPARVGLVLAVVLALLGVVSAVAKSGDDDRTVTRRGLEHPARISDDEPGDESSDEAPLIVPDGYRVVQADGIYLAVPSAWQSVGVDAVGRAFTDEALSELYPKASSSERDMIRQLFRSGALMVAVDPDPAGGGRNVNLVRQDLEVPLGGIERVAQAQFDQLGIDAHVTGSRRITTPAGTALRMTYTATALGRTFDGVQFYVPVDGGTYILTGSYDVAAADAIAATLHLGTAPSPG